MGVLLVLLSLSLLAVLPAMGQTLVSIPDFSGSWNHTSLNGLELPLSGAGPVRNRSRIQTGPQAGVGQVNYGGNPTTRRFPAPWHADPMPGGHVVRHAKGQALAYVYSQHNEADALQTMTKDEARRIATDLAQLPELLRQADR
jgi:hypothetical protein